MTETTDAVMATFAALFQPQYRADPYPLYEQWRRERPVASLSDTFAMINSYPEAMHVLRSPEFGHPDPEKIADDPASHDPNQPVHPDGRAVRAFVGLNPPDHTRLRRLVAKGFNPRTIERLTPWIENLAKELVSRALDEGEVDLMDAIARPLPVAVIAELVGVPEIDRDRLVAWSRTMALAIDPPQLLPPGAMKASAVARTELISYFRELAEERRRRPADDLMSQLVSFSDEGEVLTEGELLVTLTMLLLGGHETTTNLIGNGVLALLRHPDQYAALGDDGAAAEHAVEEILRFDSPVQMVRRTVLADTTVAGVELKAGAMAVVMTGAANRDPRLCEAPDVFDIARPPTKHVALGHGIHFCLGAPLLRAEGRAVLRELARRAPKLSLAGEPRWGNTLTMRGLGSLPVGLR